MKKMKKIVAVILLLTLALSLTACSGNSEQSNVTTQPVETQPKSAIDELNETELYIFTAIKGYLNEFDAPASVRLLDVSSGHHDYFGSVYSLSISMQNKNGGTVSENYVTTPEGELWGEGAMTTWFKQPVTDVSVGNINNALLEYYHTMGWN